MAPVFVTSVVADDIAVYENEDKRNWKHGAAFESAAMTAASFIRFMNYRAEEDTRQRARPQSIIFSAAEGERNECPGREHPY